MKTKNGLLGLGIFSGIASSLCCIPPVLTVIAGTGSLTGLFSWLEPYRWFFIAISILALGFVWYLKYKPRKNENCGCDIVCRTSFFQSRTFLGGITAFVILSLAFPYYAKAFYPSQEKQVVVAQEKNIQTMEFLISGMTCTGCEGPVKAEVTKLEGVLSCKVSYEQGNSIIKFDSTRTNVKEVKTAIEKTGYKVTTAKNH